MRGILVGRVGGGATGQKNKETGEAEKDAGDDRQQAENSHVHAIGHF